MGLDIPELDDRGYDELVEEARRLVPAFSEEWTNYNPGDPGIAILEMLAWITETYTYQLDTVTDEHREKYLKLMGERPRPPQPASVDLRLEAPEGVHVPAGTQLEVVDGSGTEKVFETAEELVLTDASVRKVVTQHDEGRTDHSHANDTEGMFYRAFGDRPSAGNAMYLGLDGDPFDAEEQLSITVNFHDDDLPDPAEHGDEDPRFFPSINLVWEYCTDYHNPEDDDAWERLSVARDGTYAFYRGGTVTLAGPEEWDPGEWGIEEGRFLGESGVVWIRCRVSEGGYEIPPQLDSVKLNVVEARHRATVEDERLRRGGGTAGPVTPYDEPYHFEHSPVLEADVTVDGEPWEEVRDFDASEPTDRHYVLDRAAGVLQFGDGVRGKRPDPDQVVVAERYVYGGGKAGNVPASSNWRFRHRDRDVGRGTTLDDVAVAPESGGHGGADAETLPSAFRRVKRDLRRAYRAVTAEDFEFVATHTPGLRFGRATVLVDSRRDDGAGVPDVTVVVVPYSPAEITRPQPSEGFIDAVERHLDRHRLLTDRVQVRPPTYVGLELEVAVQPARRYPEPTAESKIESTVQEYLDPIHGYEGDGWPFGRTLYREELYEVLEGIDWIENVRSVSVRARGKATVDGDGNVKIDDSSLFYLGDIDTEIHTVNIDGRGGR